MLLKKEKGKKHGRRKEEDDQVKRSHVRTERFAQADLSEDGIFFPGRCLYTVCAVCGGQLLTWCALQLLLPLIYFYLYSSIWNLNSGLRLV